MFYIIGLGLGDCKDITVKGLEIIKKCDKVYLEAYTSILTCGTEALVWIDVLISNSTSIRLIFVLFRRKNFMVNN